MFAILRNLFAAQPRETVPVTFVADAAEGRLTLIDVREAVEVQKSGRAKGALNIPLGALATRADPAHPDFHPELSPEKPVAVYCFSGMRSAKAAQHLRALGYAQVQNIGGLRDWVKAGGAVEP
jgi:rhodanese-related sulfurtransferase